MYAALCCYFGQWPSHFRFWLKSCSYNRGVRFMLVSDISTDGYAIPDNVQVVKMSFAEVKERIQQKFPEIKISLDRPYKLCDFKVAYGWIFDDLFCGYDYWGFYDIDTIWGDIEKFIPENSDHHLVKIFPCGHLSFIRNIAPWNRMYELVNQVAGTPCRNNMEGKNVVTWQECFSSADSHYYDEEGGLEPMLMSTLTSSELVVPFGHVREKRVEQSGTTSTCLSVSFDNILPPWRFDHFLSINFPEKSNHLAYSFEEGRLYRHYLKGLTPAKEEVSYVHFSKRYVKVSKVAETEKFCFYPNVITQWHEWTLCSLLIHGRKRYLRNIINRIMRKICR